MSKFSKVPVNLVDHIQVNVGFITNSFVPDTGVAGSVLGAISSDGFTFNSNPSFQDFGEDVGGVPPNTMQMKRIQYFDPSASGGFKDCTPELAEFLIGAADSEDDPSSDTSGVLHKVQITPRHEIKSTDFYGDLWIIGDYSGVNTGNNAGFIAVHLKNCFNNTGFQWSTANFGKGTFSFDFHGHYDLADLDEVPFDVYMQYYVENAG